MSKVYFTSDLHFGHKNLCNALRGMTSEESDKLIIDNWNKKITKYDTVYILGDISMESDYHIQMINQLKGRKILIGGNHDTLHSIQHLKIPVLGCLEYKGFMCTHIPIHPGELKFFKGNIHGHIHNSGIFKVDEKGNEINWEYNPNQNLGPNYINVNTEFHNYTPISFEEILEIFNINQNL